MFWGSLPSSQVNPKPLTPTLNLKETTGGEFRVSRASIRHIDLL